MPYLNMSSMHSSRRDANGIDREVAVQRIFSERTGRNWCLFLDRDGVINRKIEGDYVRHWRQFEWMPGAMLALRALRSWAPYLVVVTNQQGIGKGLMRAEDAAHIHHELRVALAAEGVLIDEILVCPHLESSRCECRKPSPGLVLGWLARHPDSEPWLSVVVGDSECDLDLASNVASAVGRCRSIYIGMSDESRFADASFESLWEFAAAVELAGKEVR